MCYRYGEKKTVKWIQNCRFSRWTQDILYFSLYSTRIGYNHKVISIFFSFPYFSEKRKTFQLLWHMEWKKKVWHQVFSFMQRTTSENDQFHGYFSRWLFDSCSESVFARQFESLNKDNGNNSSGSSMSSQGKRKRKEQHISKIIKEHFLVIIIRRIVVATNMLAELF